MDKQELMDVATDGGFEFVNIRTQTAVLDGEFTLEQLEAVIELLKRVKPCSE